MIHSRWLGGPIIFLTFLSGAGVAQYFGQNKVRYESFDFQVLQTPHFDVHYYPREREAAAAASRMAERWRERHGAALDWDLSHNQPIIFYDSVPAFQGTNVIPGFIGESTGGVTEGLRRRIVMPFAGPVGETDHVLGHELVHAYQYDIARGAGRGGAGLPGILAMPLWFIEGMAEYLSLGPRDTLTAMWMRDAVRREAVPNIQDLDRPEYFPYRYGHAFWAFIGGRYGDDKIGPILRAAGSRDIGGAFGRVLGVSLEALSEQWRRSLQDEYEPVLKVTQPVEQISRTLIAAEPDGFLNVGPVVSPDGKRMILFSQRDLFSIDLYLADAATGEFLRRLTKNDIDPHINAIQFVNSAGGWSRDGRWFVYPTVTGGKPELTISEPDSGRVFKRIRLEQFGEVQSPAFSPDGGRIVFSAMLGGLVDLYIVDVKTEQVRRLTEDGFAEMHPAWSPDGARIAFSTDRFTSNLANLRAGEYRLALIDVDSGQVSELRTFDTGRKINPQWSPDGRSLYFVSDRDGVPNIYRVVPGSGELFQITNVQTGVSGITSLSPAFSVASGSGRILFSAFSGGNYGIHALEEPARISGVRPAGAVAPMTPSVLPPRERTTGRVAAELADYSAGAATAAKSQIQPYRAKLSLDYIAPPSIGVGVSSFGNMVGGGTALYFSDLLGYHNLMASVQSATFSEGSNLGNSLSGIMGYTNQKHRWSWGVVGGQIPYLSGGYSQGLAEIEGQPVLVDQSILLWQINRQASGIFAYPFSRAMRVELSAGYQNIAYDAQATTGFFSPVTGEFLGSQTDDLPTPESLHLGTGAAALVYDTSIFGGTAPVLGQRWRFEMNGSGGTLNFGTALADYRRYFRIAPFTLAFRGMHYGRYGGGTNDTRLQDLYLGYPFFIRGYTSGSFHPSECPTQGSSCPVFDRLIGSRLAVGNAEVRIPLIGFLGIIPSRGFPPIDLAPFFDAGMAWNRRQPDVPDRWVRSTGVSLRFNIFGYAVGQLSYVHPLDRPARSWMWEFSLIPGY